MPRDCYLSPEGKFYDGGLCEHLEIAERIIDEVYGINRATACTDPEKHVIWVNPELFLEERGWMKYINRGDYGWWIHPKKSPTQAQIDAAFDRTGIDVSKMGSLV